MFVNKLIICLLVVILSITVVGCTDCNNSTCEERKVPDESLQTAFIPLMLLLLVFILIGGLIHAQK